MKEVFEDSLSGAADLLTSQLELAKAKDYPVQVSWNFPLVGSILFGCQESLLTSSTDSNSYRRLRAVACFTFPSASSSCIRKKFLRSGNQVYDSLCTVG